MYAIPYLATLAVSLNLFSTDGITWRSATDTLAIAAFAAGVFVVARYRGALEASQGTTAAWREERDAEVAKSARLEAELATAVAKIALLEAQPNLAKVEELLAKIIDVTNLHEENAEQRSSRIIEAVGVREVDK